MKRLLILSVALVAFWPRSGSGAQSAHASLSCYSLRFHQAEDSFGSTLDLTTVSGPPNGELRPDESGWWTSGLILDYIGLPIYGTLYVDLPPFVDANDDGFDDVFQVSQAIGGLSTGYYETAVGGGTVSATWNRAAGAKDGTCRLHLVDDTYGDLGSFQHVFEVLEYTGSLTYAPAASVVNGSLQLTQAGNPTGQVQGPASFVKVASDRYNQLDLQPGGWTNELGQPLLFGLSYIDRDQTWPTNYYGYVESDSDADTATFEPYSLWLLSIDDLNDADKDKIPDFSDDPSVVPPPRRHRQTLSPRVPNLWLTISGDVGSTNHVQSASNLASPSWQTVVAVKLTNDPQTVSVPLPATGAGFWRALAQ